jgi:His/Glu/Gln/Arg/opine family amino acid ABC transporter permease subunit
MNFGRYVLAPPYFGWLCSGLLMTVMISLISVFFAALIGLLVVQCQIAASRALRIIGAGFVIVFRNLPLVPLLLFLTFGLPGIWTKLSGAPFPRGLELLLLLLGLAVNTGAYVAEILRAGVAAVAPQQIDVARTLGLSPTAIRLRVVYPQALRIVAPSLASRVVHTVKNSTLALIVPLPVELLDVVGQAGRIAGETFSWAEPLIFAAGAHLLLSLGLDWLLNRWATHEQAKIGAGP